VDKIGGSKAKTVVG